MVVLSASPDNGEGGKILSPGNRDMCSKLHVVSAFISLEPLLGGSGLGVGADLNMDSSEITQCGRI